MATMKDGPTGLASSTFAVTGGGRSGKNISIRAKDARFEAVKDTPIATKEFESQHPGKATKVHRVQHAAGISRSGMGQIRGRV